MRPALLIPCLLTLAAGTARAGELDLNLGLQATTTQWEADHGGGPTLTGTWFFRDWIGASFTGKEQYATIDDRYLSYFSVNAVFRKSWDRVRVAGALGLVHQHEEPGTVVDSMPVESLFGVADGIRHRAGSRAGLQLAVPIRDRAHGDWYIAFDLDATAFAEDTRGPRWMSSAGLSLGFTHDFAQAAPR
ncbi:MAG TPA: hypothetical protein VFQ53_07670 [Kofleriaceae bacterium]|nr:hypothetical protein [Kofleriaceae bacterium]